LVGKDKGLKDIYWQKQAIKPSFQYF